MTNLSDLFLNSGKFDTSDANITVDDLAVGKIGYGALGRLEGVIPFSAVKLLLHMNGTDASTTFTDDSDDNRMVTPYGHVQLDTADRKFGTASGLFDGTGDYLTTPYIPADFDWWLEDFTAELWVKASSWASWVNPAGQAITIGCIDPTGVSVYWGLGPIADGRLSFYYWRGGAVTLNSVGTVPLDEWAHIAFTYSQGSGLLRLFINGNLDGSAAIVNTPLATTYPLTIGQGNANAITGALDDVRITKGYARYTTNFTPPTIQHPDS